MGAAAPVDLSIPGVSALMRATLPFPAPSGADLDLADIGGAGPHQSTTPSSSQGQHPSSMHLHQGRIQEHNKCLSHDNAVSAILEDPHPHQNASLSHAPSWPAIWGTFLRVWTRSQDPRRKNYSAHYNIEAP